MCHLIKIISEGSRKVTFFGWGPKRILWNIFVFVPRSWQDEETFFSIYLPSSKLTISLFSIYKHYAFDIADPSSMQDACHMNFVIDLDHRGVSVAQWTEHRSAESEGLMLIPHGDSEFFLYPTLVKRRKNIFFYICPLKKWPTWDAIPL